MQYETYTYAVKVTQSCAATKNIIDSYVPNSLPTEYNAAIAAGDEDVKSASTRSWQCMEGDYLHTDRVYSDLS